ncbi:chromate transporter [Anaerococcus sp. AGMB09787]|uniref:chromate transporter n=1 Tax=Anaerococcus sp. AGMB09787 TaxID=2922869 RepID=UPI001FAFA4B8|nr:chromate transporter [Anaerococcus sp. AGMB09787]
MTKQKYISYLDLFLSLFKINAVTFGGGYTIAPVIMNDFCDKRQLITKDEMLDMIALAQSGPGALAVSTSLLTGYKIKGFKGALVGAAASFLPPLIIISIIYFFYKEVATNYWVRAALRAMSGVISAVLVITTLDLAKISLQEYKTFSLTVMVISFLVAYFTSISVGIIVLILAILGAVIFGLKDKELVK